MIKEFKYDLDLSVDISNIVYLYFIEPNGPNYIKLILLQDSTGESRVHGLSMDHEEDISYIVYDVKIT